MSSEPARYVSTGAGFGHGTGGTESDLFGDGTPVYVLRGWRPGVPADPAWLRQLPSRMLDARSGVVPFTGRERELAELVRWRTDGGRLAVRWLHGPAGVGTTRLATRLAAESAAAGWKVLTAGSGRGTVPSLAGREDVRRGRARGVLLLVDEADGWPLTHLTLLLDDVLLHQVGRPTRILLLARDRDGWPAVRVALADHDADTSAQRLAPLPALGSARADMFRAARDGFAHRYRLDERPALAPPAGLDRPDFGLPLVVHMAALVAVDGYVTGGRPPDDLPGLTGYLLDRERAADPGPDHLDAATRGRVVFLATVAGPATREAGLALLSRAGVGTDPVAALADHAAMYPPESGVDVLQPLRPGRLAEDLLAGDLLTGDLLTAVVGIVEPGWTPRAVDAVLAASPDHAGRCVTALSRASQRWPELGHDCLYPLLRQRPELAVAAGSPALCALAATDHIDLDTLAAIDAELPDADLPDAELPDCHLPDAEPCDAGRPDLHVGAAALSIRLTPGRLAGTDDPVGQARLLHKHSIRLHRAGRLAESAAAAREAVRRLREAAGHDPDQLPMLGAGLWQQATCLAKLGQHELSRPAAEEAVELLRTFADLDPATHLPALGVLLSLLSNELSALDEHDRSLAVAQEAVAVGRRLAAADPETYRPFLATALLGLGDRLSRAGPAAPARPVYEEAATLLRELTLAAPARYRADLATVLHRLGVCLSGLGQDVAALPHADEAVTRLRELAGRNPARYLPRLADALDVLGTVLAAIGRVPEAAGCAEDGAAILRRLADGQPGTYLPELARVLDAAGGRLAGAGRPDDGIDAAREAVGILRRLAQREPDEYLPDLALSLHHLGRLLGDVPRPREAVDATREAATLLRRLAQRDPDLYLPDLALALDDLGTVLARLNRRDEALAAARDAAIIRCQLVGTDQAGQLADLAVSLHHLGIRLHDLGRQEQALEQAHQAIAIQRHLAAQRPDRYLRPLARSLCSLAVICTGGSADLTEAMDAAQEAIDICHRTPGEDPELVDDELALSYQAYAAVLDALGNRSAARMVRRRLEPLP